MARLVLVLLVLAACGKSKSSIDAAPPRDDLHLRVSVGYEDRASGTVAFAVYATKPVSITVLGHQGTGGPTSNHGVVIPKAELAPGKQTLVFTAQYVDPLDIDHKSVSYEARLEYTNLPPVPVLTLAPASAVNPVSVKYRTEDGDTATQCSLQDDGACAMLVTAPAGVKLSIGGTVYPTGTPEVRVAIPLLDKVAVMRTDAKLEPLVVDVLIDDRKASLTLDSTVAMRLLFDRTRSDQPARFPGEGGQGGRRSIYFEKLVGVAATWADVDAVATASTKDAVMPNCTFEDGYIMFRTKVTTTVKIVERRTGKRIAEQTFQPDPKCPTLVTVTNGARHSSIRAEVDARKITAWLTSQLQP